MLLMLFEVICYSMLKILVITVKLLFLLSKLFHLIMQFEIARHEVVHLNLNLRYRRD